MNKLDPPLPAKPTDQLVVEDLHLQYGDNPILKGVSMTLNPGEVVALLGASGSGKTTLLRSVAGLEQPSRGKISIGQAVLYDSEAGVDMAVEKRNLGLVFQSYALWPHRSVFDNVAYSLRLRGIAVSEIGQRVDQALTNLGLGALAKRLPHQLSGGQQQRVAIARALVYNPPVVLMDEPLSNLDAKLREEARAWLRELIVRLGLSALVVTHDQTEAMAMSDKILLLNFGKIEQQGTPEDMYNRPQTQFTAEFMGSNNHLPGKVTQVVDGRALLEGEGWQLWGAVRGALKIGDAATGIIRLERTRIADGDGDNRLRTEVVTGMFLGDRKEQLFKLGALRLRCYGHLPAGSRASFIELPPDDLWIFAGSAAP
ncbi:MAG: ABC transporter ATP-binding protein [Betaproteobacteria bacterium]|nr:MAG: ABC transporter ATP-binding protein [Betaproteobacteria bacterium]